MVWINSRGLRAPYVSVLHDSHPAACHGRWKVPGKHGETRSVANWKIPNARIWGFTSFNVRQIDLCIKYIYIYIYIDLFSAEGNECANSRAMAGQQVKSRMISWRFKLFRSLFFFPKKCWSTVRWKAAGPRMTPPGESEREFILIEIPVIRRPGHYNLGLGIVMDCQISKDKFILQATLTSIWQMDVTWCDGQCTEDGWHEWGFLL